MLRREFLLKAGATGIGLAGSLVTSPRSEAKGTDAPFFDIRGAVLRPDDLTTLDWVSRAKAARLTTLATHDPRSPRVVRAFMESDHSRLSRL